MEAVRDAHRIVMVDVGQGDCTAVQLRTGHTILVDSNIPARLRRVEVPAISILAEFAEARGGDRSIDLLCLTHPDRDHYTGLADVIRWVREGGGAIKKLVHFAGPFRRYNDAVDAAERSLEGTEIAEFYDASNQFGQLVEEIGWVRDQLDAGEFFRADGFRELAQFGAVRVNLLGPAAEIVQDHENHAFEELVGSWVRGTPAREESTNSLSAILQIDFGERRMLIPGDAPRKALEAMIGEATQRDRVVPFDLIKLPHHGSRSSSSAEIWRTISTDDAFALISAGCHRGYRHPHEETLDDLRTASLTSRLYCTNRCTHSETVIPGDLTLGLADEETVYHGTCSFDLLDDGTISARPENVPTQACAFHAE